MRADAFRTRGETAGPEAEALARAMSAIEAQPGILRVAHNPFTGSLLIEYQPGRVEPGALLASVASAAGLDGVVDEESLRRSSSEAAVALVRTVRKVNMATREVTRGRADLKTIVPGALFAAAAVSFWRRPLLPRWDNLLYWSYTIFRDLNVSEILRAQQEVDEDDEAP
jgi:hypothetical protein